MISEELLYYIWKFKYFDLYQLYSTQGDVLEIIDCGYQNFNSGPDFLLAKIKINGQLWAGNVEIHVHSNDWNSHMHDKDAAYNNVVLHVVWQQDKEIKNQAGSPVPTLELKNRVNISLLEKYHSLMNTGDWLPCSHSILSISDITKKHWLQRLMAERLEQKADTLLTDVQTNQNDWETIAYHKIARSLGGRVNQDAMELLARITPLHILQKHKDQLVQIEALLFGQAGLLSDLHTTEEYAQKLIREYTFLRAKYNLHPMPAHQWKYLRMRPANFPTIRIAQLARLLFQTDHLFSKLIAAVTSNELIHMFDISISQYWKNHYTFGTESASKEKHVGKSTVYHIIINTLSPLLFAYGQFLQDEHYKEKAIGWLSAIPAEKNSILQDWITYHWTAENAMDSQALIQLRTKYCNEKKCLSCAIGHKIVSS